MVMLVLFCWFRGSIGQTPSSDNRLSEPTIERPLVLRKNLVCIKAGYSYFHSQRYFTDASTRLTKAQTAAIENGHISGLSVEYGISEFLSVSSSIYNINKSEVLDEVINDSWKGPSIENVQYKTRGFSNLVAMANLRLPMVNIEGFEHLLAAGFSVPVTKNADMRPDVEIAYAKPDEISSFYQSSITYFRPADLNMFSLRTAAAVRYRIGKFAGIIEADLRIPLGTDVENVWSFSEENNDINYHQLERSFSPGNKLNTSASILLQATNRLALFGGMEHQLVTPGILELNGVALKIPTQFKLNALINCEYRLSPHFRLTQRFSYPVAGKNMFAAIQFNLGITVLLSS